MNYQLLNRNGEYIFHQNLALNLATCLKIARPDIIISAIFQQPYGRLLGKFIILVSECCISSMFTLKVFKQVFVGILPGSDFDIVVLSKSRAHHYHPIILQWNKCTRG